MTQTWLTILNEIIKKKDLLVKYYNFDIRSRLEVKLHFQKLRLNLRKSNSLAGPSVCNEFFQVGLTRLYISIHTCDVEWFGGNGDQHHGRIGVRLDRAVGAGQVCRYRSSDLVIELSGVHGNVCIAEFTVCHRTSRSVRNSLHVLDDIECSMG